MPRIHWKTVCRSESNIDRPERSYKSALPCETGGRLQFLLYNLRQEAVSVPAYSLRRASMGLSLEAFTAGTRPKIRPMRIEKMAAARMAGTLMAEGVSMK